VPNKDKEVITYYLRPLTNSIIVNDRLIKYVGISSHADKRKERKKITLKITPKKMTKGIN
jgi:hypothetical protein